jgi:hypothetical protein
MKRCIVLTVLALIAGFLNAQEFGFGNDSGDSSESGSGKNAMALSVSIGGEVSASLLGYFDDFSQGANHTQLGDIFSGKLNFSAGTSFADGVIKLNLQTTPQPVSIDEAYVRAYFGGLEIEGGLRKLTWGKADSFGPLDVINPLDYSELTDLSDPMNLKIARPLVHASYRIGSFTKIEALFVPIFEPLRFAEKDSRWEPSQMKKLNNLPDQIHDQIETEVLEKIKPILPILEMINYPYTTPKPTVIEHKSDDDLSKLAYAQAGARVTTTIGQADLGLQYYYGYLTRPAVSSTITSTTSTTLISLPPLPTLPPQIPIPTVDTTIDLHYAYNPYHQIGIDWAQVLFGFNIRAEFAVNITNDSKGDDPAVYNPALLWSFGFDRDLFAGINLNLQCNESIRLMDDKIGNKTITDGATTMTIVDTETDTKMTSTQIITAISKKFFRDALETRVAVMWGIEDKDFLLIPSIIWTRDTLSLELSAGIFGGSKEGQFGQYKDNSFIKAALTYSF